MVPMAVMATSHGISKAESATGTGRRRPEASGSPSSMRSGGVGHGDRAATAGGVGLAELHALQLDGGHEAVLTLDELERVDELEDLDALLLGVMRSSLTADTKPSSPLMNSSGLTSSRILTPSSLA